MDEVRRRKTGEQDSADAEAHRKAQTAQIGRFTIKECRTDWLWGLQTIFLGHGETSGKSKDLACGLINAMAAFAISAGDDEDFLNSLAEWGLGANTKTGRKSSTPENAEKLFHDLYTAYRKRRRGKKK